jgi:hypothetical protein
MAIESDSDEFWNVDGEGTSRKDFAYKKKNPEHRKIKSSQTSPINLGAKAIIQPAFMQISESILFFDKDPVETKVSPPVSDNINLQNPTIDIDQFYQEIGSGRISEVAFYGPYYSEASILPKSTAMLTDPLDIGDGICDEFALSDCSKCNALDILYNELDEEF